MLPPQLAAAIDTTIRDKLNRGLGRQEVAVGDNVGSYDRDQRQRIGRIIRLKDKTVTLISDNQQWRVGYGLLCRIVDIADATIIQGKITR